MDSEKLEKIVNDLTDLVNNMAFDYPEGAEIIASTLVRKHRTLQHSVLRLLAGAIKKYSELIETQYKLPAGQEQEKCFLPCSFDDLTILEEPGRIS